MNSEHLRSVKKKTVCVLSTDCLNLHRNTPAIHGMRMEKFDCGGTAFIHRVVKYNFLMVALSRLIPYRYFERVSAFDFGVKP